MFTWWHHLIKSCRMDQNGPESWLLKLESRGKECIGRQTFDPLNSNFIQNYEYLVICTLWLMYLHPLYFTDARTLKHEDILSHPYSPVQEYSCNTELLLSCPCSNSLSTIFPLRCIPLNSQWEFLSRVFPVCSSCYRTHWKQIDFLLFWSRLQLFEIHQNTTL